MVLLVFEMGLEQGATLNSILFASYNSRLNRTLKINLLKICHILVFKRNLKGFNMIAADMD